MKPLESQIHRTRMRPVREECRCAVNGCKGMMVFTGSSFTTFETSYDHQCDLCGRRDGFIGVYYPRIEFEEFG